MFKVLATTDKDIHPKNSLPQLINIQKKYNPEILRNGINRYLPTKTSILIVDDDGQAANLRNLIEKVFDTLTAKVVNIHICTSGKEALKYSLEYPSDIIFMDRQLLWTQDSKSTQGVANLNPTQSESMPENYFDKTDSGIDIIDRIKELHPETFEVAFSYIDFGSSFTNQFPKVLLDLQEKINDTATKKTTEKLLQTAILINLFIYLLPQLPRQLKRPLFQPMPKVKVNAHGKQLKHNQKTQDNGNKTPCR